MGRINLENPQADFYKAIVKAMMEQNVETGTVLGRLFKENCECQNDTPGLVTDCAACRIKKGFDEYLDEEVKDE